MAEPTFALYALRYGINHGWDASRSYMPTSNFVPHERDHRLFCYCWVARSADRTVLIDAGCDEITAAARGVTFERSPLDSLTLMGIDPADVDDIILTHLHWDHAGNLSSFPNARIHLHPEEFRFVTGPAMQHRYLRRPFDTRQLQDVVELLFEGRVSFTGSEEELAPGLSIHHVGGHTPGTQIVRVATKRGSVVLASDARHFARNDCGCDATGVPFPVVISVDDYCSASATIDRMAPGPDHIVLGHDPETALRYPTLDGDELITRLDVAPTPQHSGA
ncbi:N-acyl homoserine lactonase family protein [Mycobacterium deserti]|uniref:N-acyl homoserine lactonase family protein n=1 Tax=Mycobacterium deserti TaxID=2978347 RepID=A0ABT2MH64_9MYCO|nr:N-acyl homoserine lactonase family protein [Mycobacterium deserti]MCT7660715.1 N-acyl homoserine lactonase family protein [Mycobacterium deserti]